MPPRHSKILGFILNENHCNDVVALFVEDIPVYLIPFAQ